MHRGLLPVARRAGKKIIKKTKLPQPKKPKAVEEKPPKFNYEDMMAVKHAMKSG